MNIARVKYLWYKLKRQERLREKSKKQKDLMSIIGYQMMKTPIMLCLIMKMMSMEKKRRSLMKKMLKENLILLENLSLFCNIQLFQNI